MKPREIRPAFTICPADVVPACDNGPARNGDRADGAALTDLESFADVAATNSARLVYGILKSLAEGGKPSTPKK